MPIWYNAGKDGQPASLSISDWNSVASKALFNEFTLLASDDFYHIIGHLEKCDDIINVKEKTWKYEPEIVSIKVAKKQYKKWNRDTKTNDLVEPSKVEKYYSMVFDNYLEIGNVYTGYLIFRNDSILDCLISGKDFSGNNISPDTLISLHTNMWLGELVAEPKHLDITKLKLPEAKAFTSFGSKGQTEYERCSDRERFVLEKLNLIFPDGEFIDIGVIYKRLNDESWSVGIQTALDLIKTIIL